MEELNIGEIRHIFLSNSRIFNTFLQIKKNFPKLKENGILGAALIKNRYLMPGLRLLYRNLSKEEIKKLLESLKLTPNEMASILIQSKNINDCKLERFANSTGILTRATNEIGEYINKSEIKEIVVNGIPSTLMNHKDIEYYENSINYYVDDNFVVMLKGKSFILPHDLVEIFEEPISITLEQVFPTGLPSERFYFLVRKVEFSDSHNYTPYFDPYIKVSTLMSKIEGRNFIDFFHEFLYLLYTEFSILDDEGTKREIINRLVKKNLIWLLFEIKNVVTFLADQSVSHDVKNLQKLVEMFFEGYEYDLLLGKRRSDLVKIKILTPIMDLLKYLSTEEYLNVANFKSLRLVSYKDTFLVRSEDKGFDLGTINPYTAQFISELNIDIVNINVVFKKVSLRENVLPDEYNAWLEIDGIFRSRAL